MENKKDYLTDGRSYSYNLQSTGIDEIVGRPECAGCDKREECSASAQGSLEPCPMGID